MQNLIQIAFIFCIAIVLHACGPGGGGTGTGPTPTSNVIGAPASATINANSFEGGWTDSDSQTVIWVTQERITLLVGCQLFEFVRTPNAAQNSLLGNQTGIATLTGTISDEVLAIGIQKQDGSAISLALKKNAVIAAAPVKPPGCVNLSSSNNM
jgi:hypothetical protein